MKKILHRMGWWPIRTVFSGCCPLLTEIVYAQTSTQFYRVKDHQTDILPEGAFIKSAVLNLNLKVPCPG